LSTAIENLKRAFFLSPAGKINQLSRGVPEGLRIGPKTVTGSCFSGFASSLKLATKVFYRFLFPLGFFLAVRTPDLFCRSLLPGPESLYTTGP